MRKSLLVAAALTVIAPTAIIEPSMATGDSSSPQFQVTAGSAGTINFQGDGTAQFNNSLGTNNSFQVGSSTNLGVNASASSTSEYGVGATATLDMGSASVLKQVIGTSGSAATKTSTATAAHEVARNHMASTSIGVEWDANNSSGYTSQGDWQVAYDREYNNSYTNAYSNIQATDTSSSASGTISGVFKTKETGAATTSGSMSDWGSSASVSADAKYGNSYENMNSNYSFTSEAEYQAAYDAEYNRAYAGAAAGAQRTSESEVTVNGIGSDAAITAAETSTFDVTIAQNTGTAFGSTATAQGNAGASLATSSFANQSQASTASGFMQAFGGM